jgi:hypothetical protein
MRARPPLALVDYETDDGVRLHGAWARSIRARTPQPGATKNATIEPAIATRRRIRFRGARMRARV